MYFECTGGKTKGSSNREYTYGRFVGEAGDKQRGHIKYEWIDLSTLKCSIIPVEEVMRQRDIDYKNRQVKWAFKSGYIHFEDILPTLSRLMNGESIHGIIEDFARKRGEYLPSWRNIYSGEPNCASLPESERVYIKGRTSTV